MSDFPTLTPEACDAIRAEWMRLNRAHEWQKQKRREQAIKRTVFFVATMAVALPLGLYFGYNLGTGPLGMFGTGFSIGFGLGAVLWAIALRLWPPPG
jgi:F0F1-type ATP synthase assembly protein I